jgi:hypothetical protein
MSCEYFALDERVRDRECLETRWKLLKYLLGLSLVTVYEVATLVVEALGLAPCPKFAGGNATQYSILSW